MGESLGLGIDVAKATLCYATSDGSRRGTVDRSPAGLARLIQRIDGLPIGRALVEASGGYERIVLETLYAAGLPVACIAAGRARHGARALGYIAKTDALDAQALAELAATLFCSARLWVPLPPAIVALRALLDRLHTLTKLRDAERKRLAMAHPEVQAAITATLSLLDAQSRQLADRCRALVASDAALRFRVARRCDSGWRSSAPPPPRPGRPGDARGGGVHAPAAGDAQRSPTRKSPALPHRLSAAALAARLDGAWTPPNRSSWRWRPGSPLIAPDRPRPHRSVRRGIRPASCV